MRCDRNNTRFFTQMSSHTITLGRHTKGSRPIAYERASHATMKQRQPSKLTGYLNLLFGAGSRDNFRGFLVFFSSPFLGCSFSSLLSASTPHVRLGTFWSDSDSSEALRPDWFLLPVRSSDLLCFEFEPPLDKFLCKTKKKSLFETRNRGGHGQQAGAWHRRQACFQHSSRNRIDWHLLFRFRFEIKSMLKVSSGSLPTARLQRILSLALKTIKCRFGKYLAAAKQTATRRLTLTRLQRKCPWTHHTKSKSFDCQAHPRFLLKGGFCNFKTSAGGITSGWRDAPGDSNNDGVWGVPGVRGVKKPLVVAFEVVVVPVGLDESPGRESPGLANNAL